MPYKLTITQFTWAFILLVAVTFIMLSIINFNQVKNFHDKIETKQSQLAKEEILHSLHQVVELMNSTGKQIADWDETQQQLHNPLYYIYWRDTRLPESAYYFDSIQAVELYDWQYKALIQNPKNRLPGTLPTSMSLFVEFDDDNQKPYLFTITPVFTPGQKNNIIGYVLIKADILKAFETRFGFTRLELSSLQFNAGIKSPVSLNKLSQTATFTLSANDDVRSLLVLFAKTAYNTGILVAVLSILFFAFMGYIIVAPVRKLARYIDHLKPEELTETQTYNSPVNELQKIYNSLNQYRRQIAGMHADLDEKNQALWDLANHDPLTGVHNRRAFEADWKQIQTAMQGRRINISFMLIDCDRFKPLNDTYGHHVGDEVLIGIANDVKESLRSGDKLYRIGGDEFATLLIDSTAEDAHHVATRCLLKLTQHDFSNLGINEPLSLSIGIASSMATDMEHLHELQQQADTAMYFAKRPGNEKIAVYDSSMLNDSLTLFSNQITTAVHNAVTTGESLELHYQSITNLHTGEPEYYEALARIRNKNELMLPSKTLPIVHNRRIEIEFDMAIIKSINLELEKGIFPPHIGVSLNLSGLSLVNLLVIDKLLALRADHPDQTIYVEITETALITRLHHATENLNRLRSAGFRVCLDDFGSGYSSIRYLTQMPVDCIKFDISLIECLKSNETDAVIVRSLADMVGKAGYKLVAEGIETEEMLNIVKQVGFTHAQGYYLDKPHRLDSKT
ncbi:MAG: sensor domain-containing phosphodiesterase [Gammaproteobacteria bacterium]|nr:MAG: sensor domain-containing phosphodiesterase [Gammaproteobacteria bacterium]